MPTCFQVVTCPFIAQSRRNYHEGKLFCLGTSACVLVWLTWSVAYFAIIPGDHPGWFSVAVCAGIIATPSCLLLMIFVPKVL